MIDYLSKGKEWSRKRHIAFQIYEYLAEQIEYAKLWATFLFFLKILQNGKYGTFYLKTSLLEKYIEAAHQCKIVHRYQAHQQYISQVYRWYKQVSQVHYYQLYQVCHELNYNIIKYIK